MCAQIFCGNSKMAVKIVIECTTEQASLLRKKGGGACSLFGKIATKHIITSLDNGNICVTYQVNVDSPDDVDMLLDRVQETITCKSCNFNILRKEDISDDNNDNDDTTQESDSNTENAAENTRGEKQRKAVKRIRLTTSKLHKQANKQTNRTTIKVHGVKGIHNETDMEKYKRFMQSKIDFETDIALVEENDGKKKKRKIYTALITFNAEILEIKDKDGNTGNKRSMSNRLLTFFTSLSNKWYDAAHVDWYTFSYYEFIDDQLREFIKNMIIDRGFAHGVFEITIPHRTPETFEYDDDDDDENNAHADENDDDDDDEKDSVVENDEEDVDSQQFTFKQQP